MDATQVVPNLQILRNEPVTIADNKWGCEDFWDTGFVEDLASLPRTENTSTLGELLVGFFDYFCHFDWRTNAVCIRLNRPYITVDKHDLMTPVADEQWYVEDPFDLKHNLGGKCTRPGRRRIQEEMSKARAHLKDGRGACCDKEIGDIDSGQVFRDLL